jgi:hypothetical protein
VRGVFEKVVIVRIATIFPCRWGVDDTRSHWKGRERKRGDGGWRKGRARERGNSVVIALKKGYEEACRKKRLEEQAVRGEGGSEKGGTESVIR